MPAKMTPPAGLKRSNGLKLHYSLLFSLTIIFALSTKQFTIASHNLHGFKKSSVFHKECIQNQNGIWMAQELWLPEKRLSDLSQLGVQFCAQSGMENAFSSGIYGGRPHGGVSIAWSPNLDHVVRPLVNYKHKRIVCVEMAAKPDSILLASIYMPFYDASKRQECIAETIECITMLEEILSDHPCHKVIIGGDLNTELRGPQPFDQLWKDFMEKFDLICCDRLISNDTHTLNYTYAHDTLNQRKWNDHFLISSSLESSTDSHEIMDSGDNPSDHLPVTFKLSANLSAEPQKAESSDSAPSLKWEKCTEEQKRMYKDKLSHLLDQTPSVISSCNTMHCKKPECLASIQSEYGNITTAITEADRILPRHKPGVQKHWWTEELSRLKNKSIDIHKIWKAEGKPHNNATNAERIKVRVAYRRAIKLAQRAPKQASWNKLHGSFISKDTTKFWQTWKQLYSSSKSHLHTVVNGVTSKEDIANSFKDHFVKVSMPNSQDRVDQLNAEYQKEFQKAEDSHGECSCKSHTASLENVLDAAFKLEKGKSSDDSSISAEHFFNAPLCLFD